MAEPVVGHEHHDIEAVAALYGGEVCSWMNGRAQEWEVVTERTGTDG